MFQIAKYQTLVALALLAILSSPASSQQPQTPPAAGAKPPQAGAPQDANAPAPPRELPADSLRPNYVLGANDQILIRVPQAEEINDRPFRIDAEGFINLPLVGRVRAGGMTVQELEVDLIKRLREFINQPQVFISMVQFRSDPVFFVGVFRVPGIYPLQGRRTLLEMLASIGGLQPNASRRIKVTRRAEYGVIPLSSAIVDPDKKVSTVEIGIASLRDNPNPAEDIILEPYDVISVERAEQIYVNGEVGRIGGIEVGERDSVSVSQVLTMSGGFAKEANRTTVRVLRPILNTNRRAVIDVNVKRVLEGKDNDFPLLPNDLLYVQHSKLKAFWTTAGAVLIPIIPYLIFVGTR